MSLTRNRDARASRVGSRGTGGSDLDSHSVPASPLATEKPLFPHLQNGQPDPAPGLLQGPSEWMGKKGPACSGCSDPVSCRSGAAVMAVGVWTLVEKSGHSAALASSTFAASAYILIFAGAPGHADWLPGLRAHHPRGQGRPSAVSACPAAGRRGSPALGLRLTCSPPWSPDQACAESPTLEACGGLGRGGWPRASCLPPSPGSY